MACIDHMKVGSKAGYASTSVNGMTVGMHRKAYCQHNNLRIAEIAGMVVRHSCDNPRCINPAHLSLGTHADNVRDRVERERSAEGEDNGRAKLTAADVITIRQTYVKRSKDANIAALAKRFGVSQNAVMAVVSNKTWRHL